MSFSHTLAVIILFLALGTWFFDKELKRKEARCASICETYRGNDTASDSAFVSRSESDDDRYGSNSEAGAESNSDSPAFTGGRGWGRHRIGKCECDTGGE